MTRRRRQPKAITAHQTISTLRVAIYTRRSSDDENQPFTIAG
jgi:hypothetical protein